MQSNTVDARNGPACVPFCIWNTFKLAVDSLWEFRYWNIPLLASAVEGMFCLLTRCPFVFFWSNYDVVDIEYLILTRENWVQLLSRLQSSLVILSFCPTYLTGLLCRKAHLFRMASEMGIYFLLLLLLCGMLDIFLLFSNLLQCTLF